ncbi:hypothetical protein JAAARDRAFT_36695, partial [Jaapia argillacea MUCL 33604]
ISTGQVEDDGEIKNWPKMAHVTVQESCTEYHAVSTSDPDLHKSRVVSRMIWCSRSRFYFGES